MDRHQRPQSTCAQETVGSGDAVRIFSHYLPSNLKNIFVGITHTLFHYNTANLAYLGAYAFNAAQLLSKVVDSLSTLLGTQRPAHWEEEEGNPLCREHWVTHTCTVKVQERQGSRKGCQGPSAHELGRRRGPMSFQRESHHPNLIFQEVLDKMKPKASGKRERKSHQLQEVAGSTAEQHRSSGKDHCGLAGRQGPRTTLLKLPDLKLLHTPQN